MSYSFENYTTDLAVVADLSEPCSKEFGDNGILFNHTTRAEFADKFKNGKSRPQGNFSTVSLDSFVDYVEDNGDADHTSVFIDPNHIKVVAVLNYGSDDYAMGHADYRAILQPVALLPYAQAMKMHDTRYKQRELAEVLEDWMHEFKAFDIDGNEIDIKSAISAIRNMVFTNSSEVRNQVANLKESRSKLEVIEARAWGKATPGYFKLTTKCYDCLDKDIEIKMRLGIGTSGDDRTYKLSIIGIEQLQHDLQQSFVDAVKQNLRGDFGVYIGKFEG